VIPKYIDDVSVSGDRPEGPILGVLDSDDRSLSTQQCQPCGEGSFVGIGGRIDEQLSGRLETVGTHVGTTMSWLPGETAALVSGDFMGFLCKRS